MDRVQIKGVAKLEFGYKNVQTPKLVTNSVCGRMQTVKLYTTVQIIHYSIGNLFVMATPMHTFNGAFFINLTVSLPFFIHAIPTNFFQI